MYMAVVFCCGSFRFFFVTTSTLWAGPEPTLQMILDVQQAIKAQLDNIETNQATQSVTPEDVKQQLSLLETQVPPLTNLESAVTECKKSRDNQQHIKQSLVPKIEDLDNRSRQCKLVFHSVHKGCARA